MLPAGDFAWAQDLQDERAVQLKAELRRRLLVMPSGQRIRNLANRSQFGSRVGEAFVPSRDVTVDFDSQNVALGRVANNRSGIVTL
jgi:hypothetical protein